MTPVAPVPVPLQATRRPRRLSRVASAAVLVALAATGCGLPGSTEVRTVEASDVPYQLLQPPPPSSSEPTEGPVPRRTPVVFWLRADGRLAPSAVPASCADEPRVVVERLLDVLGLPPDEGARSAGRSSAVPPETELDLVDLVDSTALVAIEPTAPISADRLPLAMGQLVLSVTSAPGVDKVRVSIAGDSVQVPLPGGALTSRAVSDDDYAALLPDRYLEPDEPFGVASDIGCRGSGSGGDQGR